MPEGKKITTKRTPQEARVPNRVCPIQPEKEGGIRPWWGGNGQSTTKVKTITGTEGESKKGGGRWGKTIGAPLEEQYSAVIQNEKHGKVAC